MVYSSTIKRLNQSLRHKDLIQCMIEQNYVVKKDYISKWFSVQEVSKEVLASEQQLTFSDGRIIKSETLTYIENHNNTIISRNIADFKNKGVVTLYEYVNEKKTKFEVLTLDKYFHIHKPNEIVELKCYDGKIRRWYFDYKGLESKAEILDSVGNIEETTKYSYNNNGLRTQAITVRSNNQYISTYQYDVHGNLVFSEWYDDNGTRKQSIAKYNQYNDVIFEDNWWDGKRIKKEYEYNYDEYNNWIERREMNDDNYVGIVVRQFKYI